MTKEENDSPDVYCINCECNGWESDLILSQDDDGFYNGCPRCDQGDSCLMDIGKTSLQKNILKTRVTMQKIYTIHKLWRGYEVRLNGEPFGYFRTKRLAKKYIKSTD